MSFDLFYQPVRFGPLDPSETQAVRNVLARQGRGPDEHACWVVSMADGGSAEVFGSELHDGCMVAIGGLTTDLLAFLYELLDAADWVVLPTSEEPLAIAARPTAEQSKPEGFPDVVVCGSPEELGELLRGGVDTWRRYRNNVLPS